MTAALSAVKDLIMDVLPRQQEARMSVAEIIKAVNDRSGVRLGSKTADTALEELALEGKAAYQQDPGQPPRWFRYRRAPG